MCTAPCHTKLRHFFYQKASKALKYGQNALAAGALPRTPLGELTTLLQTS